MIYLYPFFFLFVWYFSFVRNGVGVVVMTMYNVYQQTIKTVIGGKSE